MQPEPDQSPAPTPSPTPSPSPAGDREEKEFEFIQLCSLSAEARIAGNLSWAGECARRAVELLPGEASGWHTLALVASDLGWHDRARECRKLAVECLRTSGCRAENLQYAQQCLFGYATSLLLAGEWEKAWPYWESGRLGYSWCPPPGTVYWDGTGQGGGLLVVCEGGYGDLFLFSRFLPVLRRKYLGRIGLFVQRGMGTARDWRGLGADDVYELGDPYSVSDYRYATSLMSLPAIFRVMPDEIPQDHVPGRGDATWEDSADTVVRIGVCFRSEENQTKRRFRSLDIREAKWLCRLIGRDLSDKLRASGRIPFGYSLCPEGKGLVAEMKFETPRSLLLEPDRMRTWTDTIRYVAGMDYVLTVDTAVAHVAGLAGVPTLLCLPLNTDWKWGLDGDTSLWYGPQFRLFRNREPLAWEVERIAGEFVRMVCA